MQQQFHNTSVNLDGLLEVLGKNLYSTASVAIRELIQNSHDACERFRFEQQEKDFEIRLQTNSADKTLTITDNGSGLTRQEIIDYLATIGSGYTRILRKESNSDDMIGYFGLGFLSAYVVSNKVEVWTSSYKQPEQSWYFTSAGGKTFTLSEGVDHPVGTTVKLHLNEKFEHLSDDGVLNNLIAQYCCLLPIPIFIAQSTSAVNALNKPWANDQEVSPIVLKKQRLQFAAVFENQFEPIACLPIPENDLGLRGLVWIQDGSTYASSDNRNVHVFIRNMFISDKEKDLLPRWAGFCGAVLESVNFQPTASREALQTDKYFKDVQEYLHDFLSSALRDLILSEPESWRRILRQHNESLLGAAVTDNRLFKAMASSLQVPTIYGEMSIKQILKRSSNKIYVKNTTETSYQDIFFRARNIPLVLGYRFAASEFCRQYAEINSLEFKLIGSKKVDQSLFKTANVDDAERDYLNRLFNKPKQEIHFSEFDPSTIPLLIVEDQEVKLKNKIEDEDNDRRIGSAALALARMHTSKISNEVTHHLYLNMSNALIQNIVDTQNQKSEITATLIYSIMANIGMTNEQEDGLAGVDNAVDHLETINQQLLQLLD